MGLYKIEEADKYGSIVLHHGLNFKNANRLARAYSLGAIRQKPFKSYAVMPMSDADKNDLDFSNDILTEMRTEEIADEKFLEEFCLRQKESERKIAKILKVFKKSKNYTSVHKMLREINEIK